MVDRLMRGRRWAAFAAAVALFFGTAAVAIAQTSGPEPIACSYDGATLSCPIAQQTVTDTASTTATVTADPVTVFSTATATSTVTPPAVTKPAATFTVTKTTTRTTTRTVTATSSPRSSTATPTPTPTQAPTTSSTPSAPASSGAYPDATNTGVPAGTTLTAYTGSCALPAGTVIDAKILNCPVSIRGAGVKISRSQINGIVQSDHSNTGQGAASVTISDSDINGGQQETFPAVSYDSVTLLRVDVTGGQHSVQCNSDCTVTDSYLHGQYLPASSAGHVNAFISNGGSGFTLTHNTLWCSVTQTPNDGGCSGDASVFGDFSQINDVTMTGNLFHSTGGSACLFAGWEPSKPFPNSTNVRITDNVFQRGGNSKCGYFFPVTSYQAGGGNTFTGNVYDDGSPVS